MRILVATSSKHGSTHEIGAFVAERLRELGLDARAMPVAEVESLDGVDAVVLGSAVYFGGWTKEAKAFVEAHRRELSALPIWLFSSGPIDPEGAHGVSDDQLEDLVRAVAPNEHAIFFGRVVWDELGFVERGIVKALRAPVGDFRDWEEIGAFVARIAAELERARAPVG